MIMISFSWQIGKLKRDVSKLFDIVEKYGMSSFLVFFFFLVIEVQFLFMCFIACVMLQLLSKL